MLYSVYLAIHKKLILSIFKKKFVPNETNKSPFLFKKNYNYIIKKLADKQ